MVVVPEEDVMSVRSPRGLLGRDLRHPVRLFVIVVVVAGMLAGLAVGGVYAWAKWHERKGRQFAARYEFDHAYEHYEHSLRIWGGRAGVHLEAARAARRAGRFEDAETHLQLSQQAGGTSAGVQLERFLIEAQNGDLARVEEVLHEHITREVPETPLILEALAEGYLKANRLVPANQALAKLLDSEPNNVPALCLLGRLQRRAHRDSEARITFDRVLQMQPDHLVARDEMSQILLNEDPAAALEHVRFLRAHQPDSVALRLRLMTCYKNLGESAEAAKVLDELLNEEPGNVTLLVERGVLALEVSDAVGAEKWLRKALAKSPHHQEAHMRLGEALVQQPGRLAEARKQLQLCEQITNDMKRVAEIQSTNLDVLERSVALLHEGGVLLLKHGMDEEAMEWLYRALQADRTHAETHRVLAEYFERTGQKDRAAAHRRFLTKQ